jgi:thiamine biosynthesis lipoprotein
MNTLSTPSTTFRAMGSQINVWLDAEEVAAEEAFADVKNLFDENEQALSRFLPDSELSYLNGRTGQWTTVSPLMWHMLQEALIWADATGGLFDPTLLNALEAAGYTRSFEELPVLHEDGRFSTVQWFPKPKTNWTHIKMDADRQAIWLPEETRIDLGGIAKGITAEQAAARLSQWGPCLVDAGGDLTAGDAPNGFPGWPVALSLPWSAENPHEETIGTMWLANATLATSGTDFRRWQVNGRLAHHLIDPRTGQPAQTDLLTTTVLASKAAAAEAWATAILLLGSETGYTVLNEHPHLSGVLITENETIFLTHDMAQLTGQLGQRSSSQIDPSA